MSNGIDKICFAYPTLFKEGMGDGKIYEPDLFLKDIDSNAKHTLVVSAGLLMMERHEVLTIIDLFVDGELVITNPEGEETGRFENFKWEEIGDMALFLSSMHLNGVRFSKSGIYEIRLSISTASDEVLRNDENTLDTYSSFFYVTVKEES